MSTADNADRGELILTETEANSRLWLRISECLEARIERFRTKNDNPMSHDETNVLRGRIAELKNLLAAGTNRD